MAAAPDAEVTLTVGDVDGLLASQFPHLRDRLEPFANGWDNEVFRLGDRLAVRLPRRLAAAELIEHEQRWLPELAARLPVPIPAPVAVGAPEGDYPWRWSVVPWFDGIRMLDLAPVERDAFADELADVLLALHRPAPADAPFNPVRGVPMRSRDTAVRDRLVPFPELLEFWQGAVAAPEWDEDPVWVHGDIHPGNLIVDGGTLVALIDFGDICGGDPACDLAIAWTGFTAHGRTRFRERLADRYDEHTWTRAKGWAASFAALVHDGDDPGLRAMAEHAIRQLVD